MCDVSESRPQTQDMFLLSYYTFSKYLHVLFLRACFTSHHTNLCYRRFYWKQMQTRTESFKKHERKRRRADGKTDACWCLLASSCEALRQTETEPPIRLELGFSECKSTAYSKTTQLQTSWAHTQPPNQHQDQHRAQRPLANNKKLRRE